MNRYVDVALACVALLATLFSFVVVVAPQSVLVPVVFIALGILTLGAIVLLVTVGGE